MGIDLTKKHQNTSMELIILSYLSWDLHNLAHDNVNFIVVNGYDIMSRKFAMLGILLKRLEL